MAIIYIVDTVSEVITMLQKYGLNQDVNFVEVKKVSPRPGILWYEVIITHEV